MLFGVKLGDTSDETNKGLVIQKDAAKPEHGVIGSFSVGDLTFETRT